MLRKKLIVLKRFPTFSTKCPFKVESEMNPTDPSLGIVKVNAAIPSYYCWK